MYKHILPMVLYYIVSDDIFTILYYTMLYYISLYYIGSFIIF